MMFNWFISKMLKVSASLMYAKIYRLLSYFRGTRLEKSYLV